MKLFISMLKKTLVLGATMNPSRYAYLTVEKLLDFKNELIPVGIKRDIEIHGLNIITGNLK